MASADIAPGTLLLAERRFLPMPTPEDSALAGGVGPVRHAGDDTLERAEVSFGLKFGHTEELK